MNPNPFAGRPVDALVTELADSASALRSLAALSAWLARMEALPGYERTYPPHWR
jgi:hypothetical protein